MSEAKFSILKIIKISFLVLIVIVINIVSLLLNNFNIILPVEINKHFKTVKIETPNQNDTLTKKLTYRVYAKNDSIRPVNFRIIYTKDGGDNWYTYIDILPEKHITGVYHLKPFESKEFESELIIKSTDNRLITSSYYDINVKVEEVPNKFWGLFK